MARRAVRAAYQRLDAGRTDFPLRAGEVADSSTLHLPAQAHAPARGSRLHVAWVTTPPGPGSGGHTTMLRMVEALEAAGHECSLHLYDRYDGELARHKRTIRSWWPEVVAEVRTVDDGLEHADVVVATSWQTAHVVASRTPFPSRRLYLVQDFEPYFYPRGSQYALAEDTYRFGFRCISIGHMVASLLLSECGTPSETAQFGCDDDVYRLTNPDTRHGVAFYARPGVDRRGYELGVLALAELARRRPETEMHVFGDTPDLPFRAVRHGRLPPPELSVVYNRCAVGLALSFTNISLTAAEMLACGVVPVVNDHPFARADLPSPFVRWARPTPASLAEALEDALEQSSPAQVSAASDTVRGGGWRSAQATVVAAVEDAVWPGVKSSSSAPAGGVLGPRSR